VSQHKEFPELTPEARAAVAAGYGAAGVQVAIVSDRVLLAAFLREAMKQATDNSCILHVNRLRAIADSLHCPPPPPPTLAEARAADLDTPEGRESVRSFLATLGEGGQP
jgi:hypothetical protein